MPRADYGPLSQGSCDTTEQFLQLPAPDSQGATPAHSPGLRSLHEATLTAAGRLKPRGPPPTPPGRPALHALLPGYLFLPRPWKKPCSSCEPEPSLAALKGLDGSELRSPNPSSIRQNTQELGGSCGSLVYRKETQTSL